MSLSPQSQSVVDQLLCNKNVKCDDAKKEKIGPLDIEGVTVLQVVLDNLEELQTTTGEAKAELLLSLFESANKETEETQSKEQDEGPESASTTENEETEAEETSEATPKTTYLLKNVKCTSFRGIAPVGEPVEFDFGVKSNLIYGPNGSGKTSLLGAVNWTLTGEFVSDSHDESDTASIHKVPKTGKTWKKVGEWSVVATLPDEEITDDTTPDTSTEIKLVSSDGKQSLFLRRSLSDGFESSENGTDWDTCESLSHLGIEPLDLQLSLHAPTIFGRYTVEQAPNTKSLLSLMLGYDDLEMLGKLASELGRNRTTLENKEKRNIDDDWKQLNQLLNELLQSLPPSHSAFNDLQNLATQAKPDIEEIEQAGKAISDSIKDSEKQLAEQLGLDSDNATQIEGLDKKLTVAVDKLEEDVSEVFPFLKQFHIEQVFPPTVDHTSELLLASSEEKLNAYLSSAEDRIRKRYDWWKEEINSENRAKLLLEASSFYQPEKEECPVCERSLDELPVKDKLNELKLLDEELKNGLADFFRNLSDELNEIIPKVIQDLAARTPDEWMLDNWKNLKSRYLTVEFQPIITRFEPLIESIAKNIEVGAPPSIEIMPQDAEQDFTDNALKFLESVEATRKAIAFMKWSQSKLNETRLNIYNVICAPGEGTQSVLQSIAIGKESAVNIAPLKKIRDGLRTAFQQRNKLAKSKQRHELLQKLTSPLNEFKKLKKYAESKVSVIFDDIQAETIQHWKTMYPEKSSGLEPSRLAQVSGRGKGSEIITYLTKNGYEVPQHAFGNAGLQRAVALSFFFALLKKHPQGLGFVIMDDPILSLDDAHRERWSREILNPSMDTFQFVVATHQEHFLDNCQADFSEGQVYELNHRDWPRRLSWQPGDILKQVESGLNKSANEAPNQMRRYCESLLLTLETYSENAFYGNKSLGNAITAFAALSQPHPLATTDCKNIATILQDNKVITVLNPGSHQRTKGKVTHQMCSDCLTELKECDKIFKIVLGQLRTTFLHSKKRTLIPSPTIPFAGLPSHSTWNKSISIACLGSAAAKDEWHEIDHSDGQEDISIPEGSVVLVTDESLDPVARLGQWVILAEDDNSPQDGDLVAATCQNGNRLLRRIWSNTDVWIFQAINPIHPIPGHEAPKADSALKKIIGVIYGPNTLVTSNNPPSINEWQPHGKLSESNLNDLACINVTGDSLDPIARDGQYVLICKDHSNEYQEINNGDLAVIDSKAEGVGQVIKRVYKQEGGCILLSPNPVRSHPPILLNEDQITHAKFHKVHGVLFDCA